MGVALKRQKAKQNKTLSLCKLLHLFIYLFIFLGLHPKHMKVPRLGVKPELQLLAYATATAMPDLSYVRSELHLQPTPQLTASPDL